MINKAIKWIYYYFYNDQIKFYNFELFCIYKLIFFILIYIYYIHIFKVFNKIKKKNSFMYINIFS